MNKQKGFAATEIAIVVVFLAAVGLVGWIAYNKFVVDNSKDEPIALEEVAIPQVETSDDLQKAVDSVNAIDIDKSIDTSDIDATLE